MKNRAKKITTCAIFSAIICVVTTFIAVPAPAIGNINLGDVFILCAAWILGPYGAISAGIGAFLADIFSGFAIYAPATLIIKALMATACHYSFLVLTKMFKQKRGLSLLSRLISALLAEAIMVLGYFAYECIIYGVSMAIASVPFNLIQGSVCMVTGSIVCQFAMRSSAIRQVSNEYSK